MPTSLLATNTCKSLVSEKLPCSSLQGFLTALDVSAARLKALGHQAEAAGVPKDMLRMRAVDLRTFAKEVAASLDAKQVYVCACVRACFISTPVGGWSIYFE